MSGIAVSVVVTTVVLAIPFTNLSILEARRPVSNDMLFARS